MAKVTTKYSIYKLREEIASSIKNGFVEDSVLLEFSAMLKSRSSTTTVGSPPNSEDSKELLNRSCSERGHAEEGMMSRVGLRETEVVSTTINPDGCSEEATVVETEQDGPLLLESSEVEAAGRQVDEGNKESSNVEVLHDINDFVSENLDSHTTVDTSTTSISSAANGSAMTESTSSQIDSDEGHQLEEDEDRTPSRRKNYRPHTGDEGRKRKILKRKEASPTDEQKKKRRKRRWGGVAKIEQRSPCRPKAELSLIEEFLSSGAEKVEVISKLHVCSKIKEDKWNEVIERSYNHYCRVTKIPAREGKLNERLKRIADELLSLTGSMEQQVREYKLLLEEDKKALKQGGGYSRRGICCRVCSEFRDI